MKPVPFDYIRPDHLEEVFELLSFSEDAKILAGGQSLIPMMNMRLARPAILIALHGVVGLDAIEVHEKFLRVGALTVQERFRRKALATTHFEWLGRAMAYIGHPQTRSLGTVGGSLAHADPSAELPLLLQVWGGTIEAAGPSGIREIPADEFFAFPYTTMLESNEILLASQWPKPVQYTGGAFREFSRRRGDFAIVAVACQITLDSEGRVEAGRLGAAGVAGTPVTVVLPKDLHGQHLSKDVVAYWLQTLDMRLDPPDDSEASAALRRRLIHVLGQEVIVDAWNKAEGETHDSL